MWQIIGLCIFLAATFICLTLFRKWVDSFILIAFAIGSIVNANFFTALTAPIRIPNIPVVFSYGTFLYAVFIFVVVIKFLHYPAKDARILGYSSVVAIEVSALIEFGASLAFQVENWQMFLINFAIYTISALASLAIVFIVARLIKKMRRKNLSKGLITAVGIFVGTLIHEVIYYGSAAIFAAGGLIKVGEDSVYLDVISNLGWIGIGSLILIFASIILALISYLISTTIFVPNEITKMILDNKTALLVRKATWEDADGIGHLVHEVYTNKKIMSIYDKDEVKKLLADYSDEKIKSAIRNTHFYVIENNNFILASAAIEPSKKYPDTAFVSMVFTSPSRDGRGLGRIILKAIENDEYAENANRFMLYSLLKSTGHYQLAGYKVLDKKNNIVDDGGIEKYIMVKDK